MIKAVFFDLDGTLVNTEELKSRTYHQAILQVSKQEVTYDEVEAAYQVVAGQPRNEVAAYMVHRFGLERGDGETQDLLLQTFLEFYERLLDDKELIRKSVWPCSLELLQQVRQKGYRTALVSMSIRPQIDRILDASDLEDLFDLVLSREMVQQPKPDPEVYLMAGRILHCDPEECLVIEDSRTGVLAALNAGMPCIALANPLTRLSLLDLGQQAGEWLVENPQKLIETASRILDG